MTVLADVSGTSYNSIKLISPTRTGPRAVNGLLTGLRLANHRNNSTLPLSSLPQYQFFFSDHERYNDGPVAWFSGNVLAY